jgi:hypothetical protein
VAQIIAFQDRRIVTVSWVENQGLSRNNIMLPNGIAGRAALDAIRSPIRKSAGINAEYTARITSSE